MIFIDGGVVVSISQFKNFLDGNINFWNNLRSYIFLATRAVKILQLDFKCIEAIWDSK